MNKEQPLENPRTLTLVCVNISLWCIYFGFHFIFNPLGPNPFTLVLLIPVVSTVLTVTTVPQYILHYVLKKKRIDPLVRTLLFFTPSILLVGIMLVTAYSSALIRSTGYYPSPSGLWTLKVFRKERSLIQYGIMDQNSNTVAQPDSIFSDYHRWAFYWESDSRLWCHSSDIGTSIWTLDKDGIWNQDWLDREPNYFEEMPEAMIEYLYSSTRRSWGNEKKIYEVSNKTFEKPVWGMLSNY